MTRDAPFRYLRSIHQPLDFLNYDHGYTTAGGVKLQYVD